MCAQRQLKEVGVREFRDHATKYLSGTDTVAVSKHGQIIGIYIPMKRDEARVREAFDRFGRTVEAIRQETGMSEDEFADIFDLNKPFTE